ncbi:MAG: CoA-binding protein [Blastocatellia bacterium]|nr:CoA-binding protein [Blastocatellia bacterium]
MVFSTFQNPEVIRSILRESKRIAVVGLSPNRFRPSYGVSAQMLDCGYEIIPVNPTVDEVLGLKCYPNLAAIPGPVDLVNIFRRSEEVPEIVEEAIAKQARAVWMQLGVVNLPAAERAAAAGLQVVMDRCLSVEYGRYGRRTEG